MYEIEYKDKTYRYRADDAMDAFNLFAKRQVYGKNLANESVLLAVDRETRGYRWALFAIKLKNAHTHRVKVRLASKI